VEWVVDDNIVYIKLVPDINDIISPDIIDVALSYSIAGIKVVLEIPFETFIISSFVMNETHEVAEH
jgi:hypothetical protein